MMGSQFNVTVPLHIHDLQKRIDDNESKIRDLYDGLHECDCEFCWREPGEFTEDEVDEKVIAIKEENALIVSTIKKLINYAEDHKIELSDKVKEKYGKSRV